ncbi:hypothetical protein [Actinokineospora sp. HUAS TT18]|uniref:hypothetical protein n=1 Tax=Actinokineospora sp. HUAS TT18 TaxID=3447451 RepID=UPI003F51F8C9
MTRPVKALSVARPWAGLIIAGHKPVENRTWSTTFRGLLVIHASQRWDRRGAEFAASVGMSTTVADYPTGYLGSATLAGMHPAADCPPCSRWADEACWHWQLTDPHAFPQPVAGPGRLGLFAPPADVLAALINRMEVPR